MPPKNLVQKDSNEQFLDQQFALLEKLKYSKDEPRAKKIEAQIVRVLDFREKNEKKTDRKKWDDKLVEAMKLVMAVTQPDPEARKRVVSRVRVVVDGNGNVIDTSGKPEAPKAPEAKTESPKPEGNQPQGSVQTPPVL